MDLVKTKAEGITNIISKIERSILPFYFFSSIVYNGFDEKILEGKFIVFKK